MLTRLHSTLRLRRVLLLLTNSTRPSLRYGDDAETAKRTVYARVNPRWEVGVQRSPDDAAFEHVSFVNSMATSRGGSHVNLVAAQLAKRGAEIINKK